MAQQCQGLTLNFVVFYDVHDVPFSLWQFKTNLRGILVQMIPETLQSLSIPKTEKRSLFKRSQE